MQGDLGKLLYEIYLMYWDAVCYESKYIDVPSDDNFLLYEGCNDDAGWRCEVVRVVLVV